MDLVGFDRDVFDGIRDDFGESLAGTAVQSIPLSALHGDNVTASSTRMPWYEGSTLLEHLETIDGDRDALNEAFRFPVQLVLRAGDDFRGYAGQILSGTVRAGDRSTAWPAGYSTTVRRIVTWDGDLRSISSSVADRGRAEPLTRSCWKTPRATSSRTCSSP